MLRILFFCLFFSSAYSQSIDNTVLSLCPDKARVDTDNADNSKRHIVTDFAMPQAPTNIYRIEIYEDSTFMLSTGERGKWVILDTLYKYTGLLEGTKPCNFLVPSVIITDFNHDGYADLEIWTHTNVNGNRWEKIFLYNPATYRLQLLHNDAEQSEVWDAPEYAPKDSTIRCELVSGNWGLSFTSKYRLKGLLAFPIEKTEHDNTRMDEAGYGAIYRQYVGSGKQWKLVKKRIYRYGS